MKNFLKSSTFYAIVSVVIAVLLWSYVAYSVRPTNDLWIEDVEANVINVSKLFDDGSITIVGDNEGITDGKIDLDIKIKGKRGAVASVSKKNISCIIDMIAVDKAGTYRLKPSIDLQTTGVEIVQIRPSNIKINVERVKQRDIAVNIKTRGDLPEGYTMEDVKYNVKDVKVTGPESVVDRIKYAEAVFDYSTFEKTDSEKSVKVEYYDSDSNLIDSSQFSKSVEYCKASFKLYTEKEVTVILTPKYKDDNKENSSGDKVTLKAASDSIKGGGTKIKVKLKGTHAAISKYTESETVVYTEPIDVEYIFSDAVLKNIRAATLSNEVDYVEDVKIDVKAVVEKKE